MCKSAGRTRQHVESAGAIGAVSGAPGVRSRTQACRAHVDPSLMRLRPRGGFITLCLSPPIHARSWGRGAHAGLRGLVEAARGAWSRGARAASPPRTRLP